MLQQNIYAINVLVGENKFRININAVYGNLNSVILRGHWLSATEKNTTKCLK